MAVQYTLRQTTSLEAGPIYRVINEITAAVNSPLEVFVFKTSTQAFDHYATVYDLNTYPNTLAAAMTAGAPFYRLAIIQRDWATIDLMEADVALTQNRVKGLAQSLSQIQGATLGTITLNVTSEP